MPMFYPMILPLMMNDTKDSDKGKLWLPKRKWINNKWPKPHTPKEVAHRNAFSC